MQLNNVFGRARGILVALAVVVTVCIFGCETTTRINVGHIGVKVKLAGSDRGVQDMQLKTGWVLYSPLTEQVVELPVSVQNDAPRRGKVAGLGEPNPRPFGA